MSEKSYTAARGYLAISVIVGWALIGLGFMTIFAMLFETRSPTYYAISAAVAPIFVGFMCLVAAQILGAHLDIATNTARMVEQNAKLLKYLERTAQMGQNPARRIVSEKSPGTTTRGQNRVEPKMPLTHYKGEPIYKVNGKFQTLGQTFDTMADAELAIFRRMSD